MKRISFIIVAGLAVLVSCKPRTSYVIEGTAPEEFEGCNVILKHGEVMDTTVVADGKFSFEGEVESPDFAMASVINSDKKGCRCSFILEPSVLKMELGEDSKCTGSALNDAYNDYYAVAGVFNSEYRARMMPLRKDTTMDPEEKEAKMEEIYMSYKAGMDSLNSILFAGHSNDVLGVRAMMSIADDKAAFDSLYNIAGEVVRSSERVVKEKTRYEQIEKTSAGCMFTDFEIANGNPDGSAVKLSDYVGKGKYILVDFWASWCGPCRQEIANLANIYPNYKSDKFDILGVAVWDERADTEKALETLPISWPVIFDAQHIPTDIYGVNGIPELVLFGPDGTIVTRGIRGAEIPAFLDTVLK